MYCEAGPVNPNIAPVSRMMAQDRCVWAPGWTERRGLSYVLKEAQAEACLDQPGPAYRCNVWVEIRLAPRAAPDLDPGPLAREHSQQSPAGSLHAAIEFESAHLIPISIIAWRYNI